MRRLPIKNPTPESSLMQDNLKAAAHQNAVQSKGSSTSGRQSAREDDHAKKDHERDDHSRDIEEAEGSVELTLISAQGLKDVRMFGSMSLYAVLWIDPSCKHRTCVSENTGSSPVWDYFLRLPVYTRNATNLNTISNANAVNRTNSMSNTNPENGDDEDGNGQRLTIQIFSQGAVSDVLVGTAHIPLQDITHSAADNLQYLACQLVRPSGRIQGLVNLSLQYSSSSSSHPVHQVLHRHDPNSKLRPVQGANRNSWFFLSEDMEKGGGETSVAAQTRPSGQGSMPIAAPDYLDFKVDGEAGGGSTGAGGSGASRSSSSANESLPHSPILSHSEFSSTQQQQQVTSKSMFDNTFDALALADAALDLTQQGTVSMLRPEAGSISASIGDALLGLAISQSLQGDNPSPFDPSPPS